MPAAIELTGEEVTIGRDEPADLVIPLPTISGNHCQLAQVDSDFYIMDLGSTNGTYLNGRQLTPAKPEMLALGDEVVFGDTHLGKFVLEETAE
ncbi:hypothetical protein CYMTET_53912 [Cymbomonas tetramitiformis]|uniref:FHA domain-containing protein n=1 Tax=Cymbomonas tetramitiformis TaxID=36881 RepID=A0AAE0BFZ0_9CHLO|nr:hypothetical protein CYMTET_53912 [Cymbomonas tetramitiformis]